MGHAHHGLNEGAPKRFLNLIYISKLKSVAMVQLEASHTVSLHLRPAHIGSDAVLYDVIDLFSEVQSRRGQRQRQAGDTVGGHVSGRDAVGTGPHLVGLQEQGKESTVAAGALVLGSPRHESVVGQLDLALAVIRQSSVGLLLVSFHVLCVLVPCWGLASCL